jgi:hypothetical protein
MTFPSDGPTMQIPAHIGPDRALRGPNTSDPSAGWDSAPIVLLDDDIDPATVVLTCANCGAEMDERKCKLICRCGYFLSCSDYY